MYLRITMIANRNFNFSLLLINKQKYIVVNLEPLLLQFYFTIPTNVNIFKKKKKLIISEILFLDKIRNVIKNATVGIKKKLTLTGLGFKIWNSSLQNKKISFKLGYSHLVFLEIPFKKISFYFFKIKRISGMLFLVVKGSDAQEIGNFIKKLKNLKKYDIYKGKGFSDKKLKIKLKLFKKK